jgi:TrpR-related protein YerC/YecD
MQQQHRSATSTGATWGEDAWITDDTRELARAFLALRTEDEALRFLRDISTVNELIELGHRWRVARLLDEGVNYHDIGERTGASSATISRVNQWLRYGRGGYRLVIDRLKAPDR